MKKHQKHTKLIRRDFGFYGPNEIAIVGAKCSIISELVFDISKNISSNYKIAYIDASHAENSEQRYFDSFTYHHLGNLDLNSNTSLNSYQSKNQLSSYDLTFINGNHFQGKKQIVILDSEKEKSILKRIDQIEDVLCFIQKDDIKIFQSLKDKFPNFKEIPIFKISEKEIITDLVNTFLKQNIAELDGLILAGGESTRMGKDKASLQYYGKEHSIYMLELIEPYVGKTFLSKKENLESDSHVITDKFKNLGPFGAICSAFMHNPNNAYLVLATDLPYIDEKIIEDLINQRDSSKLATAIKGKNTKFPEPLICIWEPKAYTVLLQYLSQGISCPRKVLINEEIKIVEVAEKIITNVNENSEYLKVLKDLK